MGRPKIKWANQCLQELWTTHLITEQTDGDTFDSENKEHENIFQKCLSYWGDTPWKNKT